LVNKIGVVGAGIMGHGIALVGAKQGFDVVMRDIKEELVETGMKRIEKFLAKSVEKEKVSQRKKNQIISRIKGTTRMEDLKDCDLVIEAIVENPDLKKKLFHELDNLCLKNTIFASNTSAISITEIASATHRADRFIGMHFMNPVPIMELVEVVRGLETSPRTMEIVKATVKKMGKIPIEVNDYPGFISNRLLIPMINEAIYCLMEGVGPRESIDKVMKIGMKHPMGPLELADLIGLDTCLYIMEELYKSFSDSKYRPCPLLKKMVKAGYLGRKTGRGFYKYNES